MQNTWLAPAKKLLARAWLALEKMVSPGKNGKPWKKWLALEKMVSPGKWLAPELLFALELNKL